MACPVARTAHTGLDGWPRKTCELSAPCGDVRLRPLIPLRLDAPTVSKHPKTFAAAGGRAGAGFLPGIQKYVFQIPQCLPLDKRDNRIVELDLPWGWLDEIPGENEGALT